MRNGALPAELGQHTNHVRLNDLLDGRIPSPDPQGEVYRHLVLAACHFYHALLPDVFERVDDETELLLPDDLLTEHSVVQPFRTEITDEDCSEVEIVGWLYQFYISERKSEVMARKSAVPTEDIPAVTQLFTPHWIVRYLVENSLGRLWLLNRPESRLREQMPYYIEGEPETDFLRITKPEEIRVLDPACGSGHMLTYAFDLLYTIYAEEGYPANDIPALILKHNLHGLDICPRAAELAELALLFKAREKSHRFLQPDYLVRPNVMELCEIRFTENELRDYIRALDLGGLFNESLLRLMYQFEEAKNFGSLIQPCLDEQTITFVRGAVEAKDLGGQLFLHATHRKVLRALQQAQALTQRYHIVVENPPYCGARYMNADLAILAKKQFKAGSSDLFATFVLRSQSLCYPNGAIGVVCPFVWMFLSDYEDFRKHLLLSGQFHSMIRLEYNAFEPACVPVSCWLYVNRTTASSKKTLFVDLSEFKGWENQAPRALEGIADRTVPYDYIVDCRDFISIPGATFAYEVSKTFRSLFVGHGSLGDLVDFTGSQNITGKNAAFVRRWWEVSSDQRGQHLRWVTYAKGGGSRKWWGLLNDVVDWSENGKSFYQQNKTSNLLGQAYWYRPGVTYSELTSNQPTFRLLPPGCVYDKAGPSFHPTSASAEDSYYLMSLCNSRIAEKVFDIVNPTLHVQVRDVKNVPLAASLCSAAREKLIVLALNCTDLARKDWDDCETSLEFCDQPLLRPCVKGKTLEASWHDWETCATAAIRRMQELETESNRLFIDAYGLADELKPEVSEEQVTLARADARRDVAAFLSYAVGCIMGRYSLDHPGLILANSGDSLPEFLAKVSLPQERLTFGPNEDGIIPMLDGEWFENDIVARTREFLRATFGDATLRENLRFIEDSLGKDLSKYFVTDFYKDHLQTYKKRPIYWMVQSPRKSFSVLVYLHRYTRDTMNLVLNRYLREYEVKLRNRIDRLTQMLADANTSTRDKAAARKESDKLIKALHDCEEWERQTVLPLAQARIELDLDDGVKTNYLKLGEALAPIAGLAAAEE
jgi:SAM-dependent methyltransferase